MNRATTFLTVLAASLVLVPAWSQNTPPQSAAGGASRDLERQFKDLDRNRDGALSREEIAQHAALAEGFAQADKNSDGNLDMAEFRSLQANASPDRSYGAAPASGASAPRK